MCKILSVSRNSVVHIRLYLYILFGRSVAVPAFGFGRSLCVLHHSMPAATTAKACKNTYIKRKNSAKRNVTYIPRDLESGSLFIVLTMDRGKCN